MTISSLKFVRSLVRLDGRLLYMRAVELVSLAVVATLILSAGHAAAQEFNPDTELAAKIFIEIVPNDTPTTVRVSSEVSGISVRHGNLANFDTEESRASSYVWWQLEPAGMARIITPMPVQPISREISVVFMEPGTVTLTAYGFDRRLEMHESDEPGFNTAALTFTVLGNQENEPAPVAQTSPEPSPLSRNEQQALASINQACGPSQSPPADNETAGQTALRSTCSELALQDDPAADLDRVLPEEFFAIGDALTTSADSQISNIRARIQNVRTENRSKLDVSALNLTLWDQTISGTILSSGTKALRQLSGGQASADTVDETAFGDSAFGVFANGNISVGSIDGRGIQRDADIQASSLTLGADYRMDSNRVVGAALGVVNDTTDFTGDNGEIDMQGISLSTFGSWYERDTGFADIVADISQASFDLTRRINFVNQDNEFAQSSTNATRLSLSVAAGRTFHHGAIEFGPVGRIFITRANIDGFSETSSLGNAGTGTALDVQSHTMTSARFSLGGEIKRVINTKRAVLVPSLGIDIENESRTDKGIIRASFINGLNNHQMQIEGADRDRNALLVSIGSTAVFTHGQSAFIYFESRALDKHLNQNRVRLGYRAHF